MDIKAWMELLTGQLTDPVGGWLTLTSTCHYSCINHGVMGTMMLWGPWWAQCEWDYNSPARNTLPQPSQRAAKLLSWQSAQYSLSSFDANGWSTSDPWQSQHLKHFSCQCLSLYERSCNRKWHNILEEFLIPISVVVWDKVPHNTWNISYISVWKLHLFNINPWKPHS